MRHSAVQPGKFERASENLELAPPLTLSLIAHARGLLRWHYTSSVPEVVEIRPDKPYLLYPVSITERALFEHDQTGGTVTKPTVKLPPAEAYRERSKSIQSPGQPPILRSPDRTQQLGGRQLSCISRDSSDLNDIVDLPPDNVYLENSARIFRWLENNRSIWPRIDSSELARSNSQEAQEIWPNKTKYCFRIIPERRFPTLLTHRTRCPSLRINPHSFIAGRRPITSNEWHIKPEQQSQKILRWHSPNAGSKPPQAVCATSYQRLSEYLQDQRYRDIKQSLLVNEDRFGLQGTAESLEIGNLLPASRGPKDLQSWPLHSITQWQSIRTTCVALYELVKRDGCPMEWLERFKEVVPPGHPTSVYDFLCIAFNDFPPKRWQAELRWQLMEVYKLLEKTEIGVEG